MLRQTSILPAQFNTAGTQSALLLPYFWSHTLCSSLVARLLMADCYNSISRQQGWSQHSRVMSPLIWVADATWQSRVNYEPSSPVLFSQSQHRTWSEKTKGSPKRTHQPAHGEFWP